ERLEHPRLPLDRVCSLEQLSWRLATQHILLAWRRHSVGGIGLAPAELLDPQRALKTCDIRREPSLQPPLIESQSLAHIGSVARSTGAAHPERLTWKLSSASRSGCAWRATTC